MNLAMIVDNVLYVRTVYPKTSLLWTMFYFPSFVNIPKPPVPYFHHHMMAATTDQQRAFWDMILQLEYALLYAAQWWNDCQSVNRRSIIQADTALWPQERLGALCPDPQASNTISGT